MSQQLRVLVLLLALALSLTYDTGETNENYNQILDKGTYFNTKASWMMRYESIDDIYPTYDPSRFTWDFPETVEMALQKSLARFTGENGPLNILTLEEYVTVLSVLEDFYEMFVVRAINEMSGYDYTDSVYSVTQLNLYELPLEYYGKINTKYMDYSGKVVDTAVEAYKGEHTFSLNEDGIRHLESLLYQFNYSEFLEYCGTNESAHSRHHDVEYYGTGEHVLTGNFGIGSLYGEHYEISGYIVDELLYLELTLVSHNRTSGPWIGAWENAMEPNEDFVDHVILLKMEDKDYPYKIAKYGRNTLSTKEIQAIADDVRKSNIT